MAQSIATAQVEICVDDPSGGLGARVVGRLAQRADVRLVPAPECAVLVWLAAHDADTRASRGESALTGITAALAAHPSIHHVVLVSSAMVYGAYANNPVPLTEDAVLRPDPEFAYARQLGAVEQLVDEWRRTVDGRTATILRPAIAVAADGASGLANALAAGLGQRVGASDPPAQFLHLDDLATAVALAAEQQLDGVYNVAPDGWIAGERVRALAGAVPRLKVPERVHEVITDLRWRFQRGPIPPGVLGYTRHPWLVANDRLRAAGWAPAVTNEQAYVEGTEAKWWTMVSPKRRQELALGVMVGLGLIIAVAVGRAMRGRATRSPVNRGRGAGGSRRPARGAAL